jgi:FtsP/CotA-like multicopper oxidase with cupredoxin domain
MPTTPIPPSLTPFIDDLPIPPVIRPKSGRLTIEAKKIGSPLQLHSDLPPTTNLWTYRHVASTATLIKAGVGATYLGPTVEVAGKEKVTVTWSNRVFNTSTGLPYKLPFAVVKVDTTAHELQYTQSGQTVEPSQNLPGSYGSLDSTVDPLRGKLEKLDPVLVTHLHGGRTQADYDGWPDNTVLHGQSVEYTYHNDQSPTILWYHDHANHVTRTNVYAGLAGVWLIRDFVPDQPPVNMEESALKLPSGDFEIPLVLQDRNLELTNSAKKLGLPPSFTGDILHKTEINAGPAEFFGPYNLVNGKIWPKLTVAKGLYRFRVLNGSNARTYRLVLLRVKTSKKQVFNYNATSQMMYLIGNDQGLREFIATIPDTGLVLAPGERADILIDFSKDAASQFYLWNVAESPFQDINLLAPPPFFPPRTPINLNAELDNLLNASPPSYIDADLRPFPQIMRFDTSATMKPSGAILPMPKPNRLRASSPWSADLTKIANVRLMCLVERPALTPQETPMLVFWEYMPCDITVPGAVKFTYIDFVTKVPVPGWFIKAAEEFNDTLNWIVHRDSTEVWYFVNLSPDTHPIHVHLVDMQLIARGKVTGEFNQPNQPLNQYPVPPTPANPDPWSLDGNVDTLQTIDIGPNVAFDFDQTDAKDTIRVNPLEAIGVAMKFGPYCGKYMIHCHILEHEDSDMMRPFVVVDPSVPNHH